MLGLQPEAVHAVFGVIPGRGRRGADGLADIAGVDADAAQAVRASGTSCRRTLSMQALCGQAAAVASCASIRPPCCRLIR